MQPGHRLQRVGQRGVAAGLDGGAVDHGDAGRDLLGEGGNAGGGDDAFGQLDGGGGSVLGVGGERRQREGQEGKHTAHDQTPGGMDPVRGSGSMGRLPPAGLAPAAPALPARRARALSVTAGLLARGSGPAFSPPFGGNGRWGRRRTRVVRLAAYSCGGSRGLARRAIRAFPFQPLRATVTWRRC